MEKFQGHELIYFHRPNCPFCLKVDKVMEKLHVSAQKKDISHKSYLNELLKIGKKCQVPCLIIDGKAMYESDDIIRWLEKEAKKS